MNIAVLITCHNRREITLRCLKSLFSQKLPGGVAFRVFLVDDGSTDGTGEAVKSAYSDIAVIEGDGSLFWCNGMRLAWDYAAKEDPDFYLWLNDDVQLREDAIARLLSCWLSVVEGTLGDRTVVGCQLPVDTEFRATHQLSNPSTDDPTIIVGSTCDPETGKQTYGGQRRMSRHPGKVKRIAPEDVPVDCDTFEGNIVLVTRTVYQKIGMLDRFSHAMGDTDYGYRAKKAGCGIRVAPGFLGICHGNHVAEAALGPEKTLKERWLFRVSGKGLPPRDWFKFLVRHAGWRGIGYWGWSYVRVLLGVGSKRSGE